MKFDVFKIVEKIPNDFAKRRILDQIINVAIPFNLSLGLRIQILEKDYVEITSNVGWKTRNHVGGAHACFLALAGEYPAGILVAQNFSPEKYRFIIKELKMDYQKQARGPIKAITRKPAQWPEFEDGRCFIPMTTEIYNSKGETVAVAETLWQVKEWIAVG